MQHCIDCGHANRPGMHFCTHCGTALVVPREGLRSPPAVVAVAVLLVGQLAFLTIRPDAPSDPVANPVANLAASAAGQAQSASSDGPGPTRAADAFASLAPAEGDSELRPATAGAGSVVQHLSERTDPASNREPTQTDPLASHAVAHASSAGADASAQRRPIADDDRDSVHAWADAAHEVQAEPPQPQTFDGADSGHASAVPADADERLVAPMASPDSAAQAELVLPASASAMTTRALQVVPGSEDARAFDGAPARHAEPSGSPVAPRAKSAAAAGATRLPDAASKDGPARAASPPAPSSGKRVADAASHRAGTHPQVGGWIQRLRTALDACDGNLIVRTVCEEGVKMRYCTSANAWGKVDECPGALLPDLATFN